MNDHAGPFAFAASVALIAVDPHSAGYL